MRFVKNGPEVPERLVQMHEEGKVVLFCGAGISRPAGLPDFKGLVDQVYQGLGEVRKPPEVLAYQDKRYDLVIDLLERRLKNRALVREQIRTILTPAPANLATPAATTTHRAVLALAQTRDDASRLVTTNFDRLFVAAGPTPRAYVAPLLPIPKRTRWNGVVYLHGQLPEDNDSIALNQLVVSSGDFGQAYLTERWASRFVSELFRTYVVCFIGYGADDPVLRYMLDAISADRLLGENTNEVFAFGSFSEGHREKSDEVWQAKGVTPILYSEERAHESLHSTIQKWAELYQDGITGKRSIIAREATAKPSPVTDDGHVDRVVWALSDLSGAPAKDFSERDPPPPVEWLSVLDDRGLLNKACSAELAPRMALVGHTNTPGGGARLDAPAVHLAQWLVNHLDKREVLAWAIRNGASLHPAFQNLVEQRLLKHDLPPAIATIWDVIASGRSASAGVHRGEFFSWVQRFKELGWSASRKREFISVLTPVVILRPPVDWSAFYKDVESAGEEKSFGDKVRELVEWEVGLSGGDHLSSYLAEVTKRPDWKAILAEILPNLTDLLLSAYELMSDFGSITAQADSSYSDRPSITDHPQNTEFRGWTILVTLARDAWAAAVELSPKVGRREYERWTEIDYPLFKRLAMYAATSHAIVTPEESLSFLLKDDAWWLWSIESQREMFRLLASLASRLDADNSNPLYTAILAGPPRRMYRDDVSPEKWDVIRDHSTWHRLHKLKDSGATLPIPASQVLNDLRAQNPSWTLEPDQRDEFPFWIESRRGRSPSMRRREALPTSRGELASRLLERPDSDFWYEDNWSEIVKANSKRAITTLLHLAQGGNWPNDVWREALQGLADEKVIRRSWRHLSSCILASPDTFFAEIESSVAWWLKVVAGIVKDDECPRLLALISRVLDQPFERASDKADSDDAVFRAINHSVGHVTQALMTVWYDRKPKIGQGLPVDLKPVFSRLMKRPPEAYIHGRVVLAADLSGLYAADQDWTATNLLPSFDWARDAVEAQAVWKGYLWTTRIDDQLLAALKPHFLHTAARYASLGKHNRQYVDLLVLARLEIPDAITPEETHHALEELPPEGLANGVHMIVRALSSAESGRETYWKHRAKPLIGKVWPKSDCKRSAAETHAMALLAIAAGKAFPDAVSTVLVFLKKTSDTDHVVSQIKGAGLGRTFPSEALQLLAAIIEKGQGWRDPDLRELVDECIKAKPELGATSDYRYLDEHLQMMGQ